MKRQAIQKKNKSSNKEEVEVLDISDEEDENEPVKESVPKRQQWMPL